MSTTAESIERVAADLGLTMTAQFVPWSQSRNAGEKTPSLNWKVTLLHNGRRVIETDYMAGSGHCPSYTQSKQSVDQANAVRKECETGRALGSAGGKHILPKFADVLHSLASDAGAIDYASYEDFASEFGYDADSRKGEAVYRACLEIALKLRNVLGEGGLKTLQKTCQDY